MQLPERRISCLGHGIKWVFVDTVYSRLVSCRIMHILRPTFSRKALDAEDASKFRDRVTFWDFHAVWYFVWSLKRTVRRSIVDEQLFQIRPLRLILFMHARSNKFIIDRWFFHAEPSRRSICAPNSLNLKLILNGTIIIYVCAASWYRVSHQRWLYKLFFFLFLCLFPLSLFS